MRRQRFGCPRLSHPHLTCLSRLLTRPFTTTALDRSSVWRFEACSYKPTSKDLPSSRVQHDAVTRVFLTQPTTPPKWPTASVKPPPSGKGGIPYTSPRAAWVFPGIRGREPPEKGAVPEYSGIRERQARLPKKKSTAVVPENAEQATRRDLTRLARAHNLNSWPTLP